MVTVWRYILIPFPKAPPGSSVPVSGHLRTWGGGREREREKEIKTDCTRIGLSNINEKLIGVFVIGPAKPTNGRLVFLYWA